MLDKRAAALAVDPLPVPEESPTRFATGTVERSKDAVQSMLVAGALAFKRDPASLNILRPADGAIVDRPRATHRAPVASTNQAATPGLTIRHVASAPATSCGIRPESERALVAIFDSTAELGETIDAHNRRKERELGELFATLSVTEARALHKRLADPKAGDAIAARFGRMIAERRQRLLLFLADARRREAIHAARR